MDYNMAWNMKVKESLYCTNSFPNMVLLVTSKVKTHKCKTEIPGIQSFASTTSPPA